MKILNRISEFLFRGSAGEEITTTAGAFDVYIKGGGVTPKAIMQAYGKLDTGTDAYATLYTAVGDKGNADVYLSGAYDAVLSFDGGTTEHFIMPANSTKPLPNILIPNGTVIKAKNLKAGENFLKLVISAW